MSPTPTTSSTPSSLPPLPPNVTFHLLTLPTDAKSILRLHYQVYLTDPLHSDLLSGAPPSEEEYVSSSLPSMFNRLSPQGMVAGKLVYTPPPPQNVDPSSSDANPVPNPNFSDSGNAEGERKGKLIAYITFLPPSTLPSPPLPEKIASIKTKIENDTLPLGIDRALLSKLKVEDAVLTERFLGQGWEAKWWELDALVVDEGWQGRGLGAYLVAWGWEEVGRLMREGKGKAEGVYLIGSPQGERVYSKSGFVRVGERSVGMRREKEYTHGWFIKIFV